MFPNMNYGGWSNFLNMSPVVARPTAAQNLAQQQKDALSKIVSDSANVQFRDPSSYFYGFTGNPYMQKGTQQTAPMNVASPRAMPANDSYQQALQTLMQQYNLLG